jgi:hypothetical protein
VYPGRLDSSTLVFSLSSHRHSYIGLIFISVSGLTNDLPEESDQFRFLRTVNLKGSVGLILVKASVMGISIPFDLSSRSFTTITVFHSFETSYVTFSEVYHRVFYRGETHHSFSVTFFVLGSRLFYSAAINLLRVKTFSRFRYVDCGLQLLVRVWFVFIVLG